MTADALRRLLETMPPDMEVMMPHPFVPGALTPVPFVNRAPVVAGRGGGKKIPPIWWSSDGRAKRTAIVFSQKNRP